MLCGGCKICTVRSSQLMEKSHSGCVLLKMSITQVCSCEIKHKVLRNVLNKTYLIQGKQSPYCSHLRLKMGGIYYVPFQSWVKLASGAPFFLDVSVEKFSFEESNLRDTNWATFCWPELQTGESWDQVIWNWKETLVN
jgi:hypothetical protein